MRTAIEEYIFLLDRLALISQNKGVEVEYSWDKEPQNRNCPLPRELAFDIQITNYLHHEFDVIWYTEAEVFNEIEMSIATGSLIRAPYTRDWNLSSAHCSKTLKRGRLTESRKARISMLLKHIFGGLPNHLFQFGYE
ncbi:hypothetical protein [Phaeocystidibacter marisrubri]|uniref:Uncharacterized protein n=1 Tax=Phaeocystidibacter marisrubri TaxID=1577780 RepID=A0A6L3ZDK7_9FLAO|nr:hypothetical protein [Phaeocystidibacter marisrubri]KAB2815507.1 hypothetical protein F8C82_07315 [Phaeocystidibacter marisrubri]GGH64253.1 hypothetical protein GCM10011318_00090 [Phaeocystidibacter marisrubri]